MKTRSNGEVGLTDLRTTKSCASNKTTNTDLLEIKTDAADFLKWRQRSIGGAAPPKNGAANDDVARGREAWQRRKADERACWEDYKLMGRALCVGSEQAM